MVRKMVVQKCLLVAFVLFYCLYYQVSARSDIENFEEQDVIIDNYEKWSKLYLSWLTEEQKTELKEMIKEGDSLEDLHTAVMEMYDTVEGDRLRKINEGMNIACMAFIDYLTQPSTFYISEFETIAHMAYDPYTSAENKNFIENTRKRLINIVNQLISDVKDVTKKKLARKYLPSCMKIFLSASQMVRHHRDYYEREKFLVNDLNINNWERRYLSWLSEEDAFKLKTLRDEGAPLHEVHLAIKTFYSRTSGESLMKATGSLYDGCVDFAVYLLGEENVLTFITFMEDAASSRQKMLAKSRSKSEKFDPSENTCNDEISSMGNWLIEVMKTKSLTKQHLVANYLTSCVDVIRIDSHIRARRIVTSAANTNIEDDDDQEHFLDSFYEWKRLYLVWLTDEQNTELNKLREDGATVDKFHTALMAMYDSTDANGELLNDVTPSSPQWKAKRKANVLLKTACLHFVNYLDDLRIVYYEEFSRIVGSAFDPYTTTENIAFQENTRKKLTDKAEQLNESIKDTKKRNLARRFLPSCVKIFQSSSYMIRSHIDKFEREEYLLQESDIDEWQIRYLQWLEEGEKRKLKALRKEGTSLADLYLVVSEVYAAATGDRFIKATLSLSEGCSVFVEYLFGKQKASNYISFLEKAFSNKLLGKAYGMFAGQKYEPNTKVWDDFEIRYQKLLSTENEKLLNGIDSYLLGTLAKKYLGTCLKVFENAYSNSSIENIEDQEKFLNNFDALTNVYLKWLEEEQRTSLNALKISGSATLDNFHTAAMENYYNIKGSRHYFRARIVLYNACFDFVDFLTKPSESQLKQLRKITRTMYDTHTDIENGDFQEITEYRLKDYVDQLISDIANTKKRSLASKFLPSCVFIILERLVVEQKFFHDNNQSFYLIDGVEKELWTNRYLNWLSEAEHKELNKIWEAEASIYKIHTAVIRFWKETEGDRFIKASRSLSEGCKIFAEFLLSDDIAALYIAAVKEAVEANQKPFTNGDIEGSMKLNFMEEKYFGNLLSLLNEITDALKPGFRKGWADIFLGSCTKAFVAAFRTDTHKLFHDEI